MRSENARGGVAVDVTGGAADSAAAARKARFGTLPERIRPDETVETQAVAPNDPTRHGYDPERSWTTFSCLAADLGL
ncbi:hypothetical protein [Streptomyces sp. NPDC001500]